MVVVNKKQFYAGMQQPTHTLDKPYKDQSHDSARNYITGYSLLTYTNRSKIINSVIALIIFWLSFGACCVTLGRSYKNSKMPSNIISYSLEPWDEYSSLENTLKAFTNTSSTIKDNVKALWYWSLCDQYITTGRVPKSTDKMALEVVSASNPVYMPGGCNCIAQVAHAMGDGWLYESATNPTKGEVKEMLNFCTYEGSMPQTMKVSSKPYRTMFFIYGFLLLASSSIIIANFMHDVLVLALKDRREQAPQGSLTVVFGADTIKKVASYLNVKLILVTLMCTIIFLVMTILLLTTSKGAPDDAKHPADLLAGIFIAIGSAIILLFVTPYVLYGGSSDNIARIVERFARNEVDAGIKFIREEHEITYKNSDILNAQGQIEQLWTDVISIPAVVALTVAVCIMRQWTDFDIIMFNVILVFLLLIFATASNWVTCHWTRVASFTKAYAKTVSTTDSTRQEKLNTIGETLNSFYQGYKNIITVTQIFILLALVFTATPSSDVNHYNYLAMYNWIYFMGFLFLIYMAPDIWNDMQQLKLHNVTAIKQLMLNLLSFTVFITVSYTEFWNKSLNQDPLLRDNTIAPMSLQKAYDILDFQMFMMQNPHLITDLEWHELGAISDRMESRIRLNESKAWKFWKDVKKRATEAGKAAYEKGRAAANRARRAWGRQPAPAQAGPSQPVHPMPPPEQMIAPPPPGPPPEVPQEYGPAPPPPGYLPPPPNQETYGPRPDPEAYMPQQPQEMQDPNHIPQQRGPPPEFIVPDGGVLLIPAHHAPYAYPPPPPGAVEGISSPFLTIFNQNPRHQIPRPVTRI
ncbi:hypothetical protein GUITHDRAFT_118773 [Guillardia theta CCMP2712]|uniref:Uncharacterized protein n=1 Tax=Guillardia theta (strain CCMP2712) TaxID=905079 RepID=L1IGG7_GUITC|nr:hypothetical protein GUITHDRAFT_118773 [Guillardia theta CCMP2712]EKX35024.1 hypothetical protein GUITHDRAFT_118773 [Guillardia theta CCMP2712]|eukprot:XP_005822004.1 hypothetical protein GUITHDRAFT_118773 [Guillardia theta CCMP2712]